MSIDLDLARRLEKNPKTSYVNGVTIFLKLLTNIIENPNEEKYRKFKRTNQRISSELLSLDGMTQLVQDAGFELDGDEFVLRRGGIGVITKLKSFRYFFEKRLESIKSGPTTLTEIPTSSKGAVQKVTSPVKQPVQQVKIEADQPFRERIRFLPKLYTANNFLIQLEQLSDSVMQYEDKTLQKTALQLVPTEKLKERALENLRKLQKLILSKAIDEVEPPLEDLILEELAAWFKDDFFTWVNAMPCKRCGNKNTGSIGTRTDRGVLIEVSHRCVYSKRW